MFVQYLRGRASELLAIRATAPVWGTGNRVIPVVEPVKKDVGGLGRAMEAAAAAGGRIAVIVNPVANRKKIGAVNVLRSAALDANLVNSPSVLPALLVLTSTRPREVDRFFQDYAGRPVLVVHYEAPYDNAPIAALERGIQAHTAPFLHVFESRTPQPYQTRFAGGTRIQLKDGFRRQPTNAHYAGEEFFSDGHLTYAAAGFDGCGDYSVVGDHFAEGGSTPRAVVIHMTYQRADGTVWVHHFVSDTNTTQADTAGKFLEAARKVRRFAQANAAFGATAACQEVITYLQQRHFPNLPKLKELSMRHHLELMASII